MSSVVTNYIKAKLRDLKGVGDNGKFGTCTTLDPIPPELGCENKVKFDIKAKFLSPYMYKLHTTVCGPTNPLDVAIDNLRCRDIPNRHIIGQRLQIPNYGIPLCMSINCFAYSSNIPIRLFQGPGPTLGGVVLGGSAMAPFTLRPLSATLPALQEEIECFALNHAVPYPSRKGRFPQRLPFRGSKSSAKSAKTSLALPERTSGPSCRTPRMECHHMKPTLHDRTWLHQTATRKRRL